MFLPICSTYLTIFYLFLQELPIFYICKTEKFSELLKEKYFFNWID